MFSEVRMPHSALLALELPRNLEEEGLDHCHAPDGLQVSDTQSFDSAPGSIDEDHTLPSSTIVSGPEKAT